MNLIAFIFFLIMVGAAFFGKKDSGKRKTVNQEPMSHAIPTPSAVATTPLHPDKVIRTGGIIAMRLPSADKGKTVYQACPVQQSGLVLRTATRPVYTPQRKLGYEVNNSIQQSFANIVPKPY